MKRTIAALAATGILAACSPAVEEESADMPEANADEHYYPSAAEGDAPANPWILILPGGGGIEVFGDTEFYFDVARHWNAQGLDALVVHYQAAAPILGIDTEGAPGPMEAAVVEDALAAAQRNGWLDLDCPGFVVGYSMGGAGATTLAANPPANLAGAIGYYPLVIGQPEDYVAQVPMLVLQGDQDDFTTMEALDAFLAGATPEENFQVHVYEGAEHGFDIPSLAEPVEYEGGIFQYGEAAAEAAKAEGDAFVARILAANPGGGSCATPEAGE